MKLVIMMFLEDDSECAEGILAAHGVTAYSELPVQGRGGGAAGWYGEVAPFRSRMIMTFLPVGLAEELTEAVRMCQERKDPGHPIRAWQVNVERAVSSGDPVSEGQEVDA